MHKMLLLLVALLLLLPACTSTVSVKQWQDGVENYVANQANGDLAALRHVTAQEDRTFAVIGQNNPEMSADVVGVLVGHPIVQRQPWAVFLVGNVDRGELTDTRLAAVAQHQGRMIWHMGKPDDAATSRYLQARTGRPIWPHPADNYTLTTRGTTVQVTERTSGATWQMTLPPQAMQSSGVAVLP